MNKEKIIDYLEKRYKHTGDSDLKISINAINNLQKENEQFKEQQKFLYHIRQDTTSIPAVVRKASDEEIIKELQQENFKLQQENKQLKDKNKQLKEKVNKAIEYMEKEMPYLQETDKEYEDINGNTYYTYKEYDGKELLEILKGDSNE